MKKRQLHKRSKRRSLSDKYRVQKRVRDHHKKVRKEAKKAEKLGLPVKSSSKLTKIPNLFPGKKQILEEHDILMEIEKNKEKHKLITTEDIKNLVVEDEGKNIIQKIEEENKDKSKYDAKRELNSLTSKCDIIIEVVDARDPFSYRSKELESNVMKSKEKRLVLIINKIDLVKKENAESWGKLFRRDYPTVLFSAKDKSIFEASVEELLSIIKELDINTNINNKKLHIGLVGYPNTGKTTLVNLIADKFKALAKSTLIPGFNEIILDSNLRLIANPAHIFSKNELGPLMPKSAKNMDGIKSPLDIVKVIVEKIEKDALLELYEIPDFNCHIEFLENIAKNKNFRIKGGYLDSERAARLVLSDVCEGRIKYQTEIE